MSAGYSGGGGWYRWYWVVVVGRIRNVIDDSGSQGTIVLGLVLYGFSLMEGQAWMVVVSEEGRGVVEWWAYVSLQICFICGIQSIYIYYGVSRVLDA